MLNLRKICLNILSRFFPEKFESVSRKKILQNQCLNCKTSGGIADRGVMDAIASVGLIVVSKLEAHSVTVATASAKRVDRT